MHLPPPPRRPPELRLLPMIDVVFFLIVFFMMAAHFASPQPFAIARPQMPAPEGGRAGIALYLAADGRVGLGGARARVVPRDGLVAELAQARALVCARAPGCARPPSLWLYADRGAAGADLARLMADLAAAGYGDVRLAAVDGAAP